MYNTGCTELVKFNTTVVIVKLITICRQIIKKKSSLILWRRKNLRTKQQTVRKMLKGDSEQKRK